MYMIQHLKTRKTIMAEKRSWWRTHLGKTVNWEEYGKEMVFEYQLGFLTAEDVQKILED